MRPEREGRALLATPKWLFGHLLALILVVAFLNFGSWQLRRHAERLERNAAVEARLSAPVTTLDEALSSAAPAQPAPAPDGSAAAPPPTPVDASPPRAAVHPLAYRRVRLQGHFDPEHEVLRRPVARDGVPGFHVVTPLVQEEGRAVLVERGWVPQDAGPPPVRSAAPPTGVITIDGWVFPGERPPEGGLAWLAPRDPADGPLETVAYVDPVRLADQIPYPLVDAIVLLEAPPRAPGDRSLPLPPPPPTTDVGPHLGYAIQWFAFALVGIVGYAALLRSVTRERRERPVSPPPSPARPRDPGP